MRLILLSLLLVLAAGCTTHVIPPPHPADPVTIYLTDYGKHSSLLLPSQKGGYDEYAFGDWDYFALGRNSSFVGIRALLGSPQSSLGRRHIDATPTQSNLGAKRLMQFNVPRQRAEALAEELDARFQRNAPQSYYSDYSKLYQVRDPEFYWLFHNCNNETADWLRELDCKIRGTAVFSNFTITPPK